MLSDSAKLRLEFVFGLTCLLGERGYAAHLGGSVFAVACSSAQAKSPDSTTMERLKRENLQALLGTISSGKRNLTSWGDGC